MDKSALDTSPATHEGAPAPGGAGAMAQQVWYDLILRRCGLAVRHARLPDVIETVRDQMRARGVESEAAYYQLLGKTSDTTAEWDALMERLLNHETSFFRHPPSFEALRTHILPELHAARACGRGGRLNMWSAGCSTGQEAYSLAMVAMADETLKGDFTVWGGDISRSAIERARRGRYGRRAALTVPAEHRLRFLRPIGIGPGAEYEIVDDLRQRVRFMAMNLVGGDAFGAKPRRHLLSQRADLFRAVCRHAGSRVPRVAPHARRLSAARPRRSADRASARPRCRAHQRPACLPARQFAAD